LRRYFAALDDRFIKLFASKKSFETSQHLFIIMSTYLNQDMMFEDAYDGINFDGLDSLSVGSLDVDEAFDFPVQAAITAPAEESQQTAAMKPRMVSMEDISSIRKATTQKEVKLTPYDSLRLLVKNKQQGVKRSTECHTVIEDDSTSSFPRAFLSDKQTQPVPKHRKVTDPFLLHQQASSNRDLSLETVQGILREDPGAASRQLALFTERKVYNYLSHQLETKRVRESYTYPLNMALEKGVNADVIKSLIDADKAVLGKKDGLEQEGSLHILLKHHKNNGKMVGAILVANPSSVEVEDRQFNTPLHVACRSGASMDVIRHLWVMYPGALAKRNFQGLTPLDVARTNGHMCSDGIAYFLWQKVQEAHLTF
jgi:hypothetical protein